MSSAIQDELQKIVVINTQTAIIGPQGFQGPIGRSAPIVPTVFFSATSPSPTGTAIVPIFFTQVIFSDVTSPAVSNPAYNPATGLFTAPTTGTYQFGTTVNYNAFGKTGILAPSSGVFTIAFSLNSIQTQFGSNMSVFNTVANENPVPSGTGSITAILQLNAGDTVGVIVTASGGFLGQADYRAVGSFSGVQLS